MDEEATSWVRRAKFSHTVCHRLDGARLSSLPRTFQQNTIASLKSRPQPDTQLRKPGPDIIHVQRNPITNRQRAVSPSPEMKISPSFREARSEQKRFSTPNPQRKGEEKGKLNRLFNRHSGELRTPSIKSPGRSPFSSPMRHLTSMRFHDKIKSRKDSAWTKYFDHGGGRVTSVESADDNMLDRSQLLIGQKFAHGAHSQLYRARYMDEDVALKLIQVRDNDENGDLASRLEKQFIREITLLPRLHHPNVVKFVSQTREQLTFCIVTEYVSEGSLRAYLHKLERNPLPLQKLISMALDIARGMEYIHSQGIIHRDLKPENILITKDFHLKIADFGIACEEASCDSLADDPGTYRWMAPEMIKRKPYGRKVDVYGFGLILWELVSGTIPYEDMTPIQAAFAVVNKNSRPAIPRDCAPAMKSLIEQCWSLQPDKRPEFWQIVKVLEEFESSLARDGNLNMVQNLTLLDHNKGLRHWIQKLRPTHQTTSSMPKPKLI